MFAADDRRIHLSFIPQHGPQMAFLKCPCDIVVYGGARGGGKTYAVLGEFWIHAEEHGTAARGLIVRKSREDLKDTLAVATEMYGNAAKWIEKGAYFRFHNGARLYAAYLENERDADHYQGWNLTRVYVEELTQLSSADPVLKLLGALRSSKGIRVQLRCTCNPGGVGHTWVKAWVIDNGAYQVVTDEETGLSRVFIPAKLSDNPALLSNDPTYINRLKAVGTPQLVQAWLEGDWNVVEGAFFDNFSEIKHIIKPFPIPLDWTRFMGGDWGSAKPFSFGWYAVVQEDFNHDGRILPRGAIVRYREYYGMRPGRPNVGLKMTAEQVAMQIVAMETDEHGVRERINYRVLDPGAFNVVSGPSIGETMARAKVPFRRADNTRVSTTRRMGGWDQVRNRLDGDPDGRPMLYFFSTCYHMIRTLPVQQHDEHHAEDIDSEGEDHCVDELRYSCMSRPYIKRVVKAEDKNPLLVKNAFKLDRL
jgi:hypothetical protein